MIQLYDALHAAGSLGPWLNFLSNFSKTRPTCMLKSKTEQSGFGTDWIVMCCK